NEERLRSSARSAWSSFRRCFQQKSQNLLPYRPCAAQPGRGNVSRREETAANDASCTETDRVPLRELARPLKQAPGESHRKYSERRESQLPPTFLLARPAQTLSSWVDLPRDPRA